MPKPADSRLKFRYDKHAKSGYLDQALVIKASGRDVLAPTLVFTPVDRTGRILTHVDVRTAYGSDEGRLAVFPRGDNIELLHFRGSDARQVDDVRVTAHSTMQLPGKRHRLPRVVQFDKYDGELQPGGGFDHVRVFNDDRTHMQLRAVMLVLDDGRNPPQGALEVLPLVSSMFTVPPRSQLRIDPPDDVRSLIDRFHGRNFISVKAFPAAK